MADYMLYVSVAILINIFIGAGVASYLTTSNKDLYIWYKKDPTGGAFCFLILTFWPAIVVMGIKHKRGSKK